MHAYSKGKNRQNIHTFMPQKHSPTDGRHLKCCHLWYTECAESYKQKILGENITHFNCFLCWLFPYKLTKLKYIFEFRSYYIFTESKKKYCEMLLVSLKYLEFRTNWNYFLFEPVPYCEPSGEKCTYNSLATKKKSVFELISTWKKLFNSTTSLFPCMEQTLL